MLEIAYRIVDVSTRGRSGGDSPLLAELPKVNTRPLTSEEKEKLQQGWYKFDDMPLLLMRGVLMRGDTPAEKDGYYFTAIAAIDDPDYRP